MAFLAWFVIGLGFAGVILPVLPATPLVSGGILWLGYLRGWQGFVPLFWVGFIVLTVVSIAADYVVMPLYIKKKGSSKRGSLAAAAGMIIGAFFSLPGLMIGPLIAVFIAELTTGANFDKALHHALNTLLGIVLSALAKFIALILLVVWYLLII